MIMNNKFLLMVAVILLCISLCNENRAVAQPSVTFSQASSSTYSQSASLTVTTPAEGAVVTLQTLCGGCTPVFEFDATVSNFQLQAKSDGNFPCEPVTTCDTCRWKGDGQHIYVVFDNGRSFVIPDLNSPMYIPVDQATPGPHTLAVYMNRSWDESLKDVSNAGPSRTTSLYTVRTFYIDTNVGGSGVDTTLPLLCSNSPLDTLHYKYPADSVLFDFYMMFKDLADGYMVEVTVSDSVDQILGRDTLTEWTPYCIEGLQEPPIGRLRKYFIQARLLNTSGNPVSNGTGNFNDRRWPFWVRRS